MAFVVHYFRGSIYARVAWLALGELLIVTTFLTNSSMRNTACGGKFPGSWKAQSSEFDAHRVWSVKTSLYDRSLWLHTCGCELVEPQI